MVGKGGLSFKRESILGFGEVAPGPCLQPAPQYPSLECHPTPLSVNSTALLQLALRLDLFNHHARESKNISYAWEYFPNELRPGIKKRKQGWSANSSVKAPKVSSIDQLLADLEKTESARVKTEREGSEVGNTNEELREEEEFVESDEEMDDGTDYNQNYFDNGEGYLDEDDDLDDGPTY